MRIIARMRQHGNGEQGVDAIQQGVAEAVREAAGCAIPIMVSAGGSLSALGLRRARPGNHAWPNGAAGSVPRISSGSQVATGMSCHGSRSGTGNPICADDR